MRKRPSAPSGFNILESLVVLLIIILLASIVIPALLMKSEEEASPKPARVPGEESGEAGGMARDQASAGDDLRGTLAEE